MDIKMEVDEDAPFIKIKEGAGTAQPLFNSERAADSPMQETTEQHDERLTSVGRTKRKGKTQKKPRHKHMGEGKIRFQEVLNARKGRRSERNALYRAHARETMPPIKEEDDESMRDEFKDQPEIASFARPPNGSELVMESISLEPTQKSKPFKAHLVWKNRQGKNQEASRPEVSDNVKRVELAAEAKAATMWSQMTDNERLHTEHQYVKIEETGRFVRVDKNARPSSTAEGEDDLPFAPRSISSKDRNKQIRGWWRTRAQSITTGDVLTAKAEEEEIVVKGEPDDNAMDGWEDIPVLQLSDNSHPSSFSNIVDNHESRVLNANSSYITSLERARRHQKIAGRRAKRPQPMNIDDLREMFNTATLDSNWQQESASPIETHETIDKRNGNRATRANPRPDRRTRQIKREGETTTDWTNNKKYRSWVAKDKNRTVEMFQVRMDDKARRNAERELVREERLLGFEKVIREQMLAEEQLLGEGSKDFGRWMDGVSDIEIKKEAARLMKEENKRRNEEKKEAKRKRKEENIRRGEAQRVRSISNKEKRAVQQEEQRQAGISRQEAKRERQRRELEGEIEDLATDLTGLLAPSSHKVNSLREAATS